MKMEVAQTVEGTEPGVGHPPLRSHILKVALYASCLSLVTPGNSLLLPSATHSPEGNVSAERPECEMCHRKS